MSELTKQAPGIDEQIAYAEYLCEGESMAVQRAILATLREYKRITEAGMPEEPEMLTILLSANPILKPVRDHIDTLRACALRWRADAESE